MISRDELTCIVGPALALVIALVMAAVLMYSMPGCGDLEYVPVIIPGPVLKCPTGEPVVLPDAGVDNNDTVKCPDVECPAPLPCPACDDNCSAFPGNGYGWQKVR